MALCVNLELSVVRTIFVCFIICGLYLKVLEKEKQLRVKRGKTQLFKKFIGVFISSYERGKT
jgi:hypothetical protein